MKVPELKAEAKRLGLNNYSKLRKQELIDLLRNQTEAMDNRKLPELKAEAKRLGLNHYSRLREQELVDLLRNQRTPTIEPLTKKIPAPGTKKIPSPTKTIEMSPKEIERKVKRLKKAERNQSKNKKQQKEKTQSSSTTVKIETGK